MLAVDCNLRVVTHPGLDLAGLVTTVWIVQRYLAFAGIMHLFEERFVPILFGFQLRNLFGNI